MTCLKCGHQTELAGLSVGPRLSCVCGDEYTCPEVLNTGVLPNEKAAERSRNRAFRAAGVVKNVGGFALGIAVLGALFPPFGLVGAAVGVYVLTMLRGPVGRYSGRRSAVAAVIIGATVFIMGMSVIVSLWDARRIRQTRIEQNTASQDLRALLRAQRLFRASNDTFGTFGEFAYTRPYGRYTIYLGADDWLAGHADGKEDLVPLPGDLRPGVSESAFTAVAVANLDGDPALDIWILYENGDMHHLNDDVTAKE